MNHSIKMKLLIIVSSFLLVYALTLIYIVHVVEEASSYQKNEIALLEKENEELYSMYGETLRILDSVELEMINY